MATAQERTHRRTCHRQATTEQLHARQPHRFQFLRRFLHPRVLALSEHDASFDRPSPFKDAVQKSHFPNLRLRACWTVGSTSCETSPPKRATSRTRLELTKVRSKAGTRNTVSILGARLRFISAIWNSYSKSDTARKPRIITEAPTRFANSASSPSNDCTCKRLSGTACLIRATRSSSEKSGCLETFTATATMS